ncbi:solute symporter family protein [Brevibacillus daliensis]|uniref:solute symporter family protein n=1 Tax=Brevibacillus daliensis TaxID=2892995 RepID=UPI001E5F7ACA|nr:cation acetate symporter [Brevibacillus daliensis]
MTGFFFFAAIIIGTLAITFSASKRTTSTNDFYAAGNRLSGLQNGFAIAGDFVSAASFLGITGMIALYGFDGFFYAIGFFCSYLIILLLIAEPMHNLGRYTLADSIAVRFPTLRLRGMIALTTLILTIIYMMAQLVGAGALIFLLLDLPYEVAVMVIGLLMTVFVVIGGMVATSWIQIVKSVLLLFGTLMLCLMVLARFDWSLLTLFEQVSKTSTSTEQLLEAGHMFSQSSDTFSLYLALLLGTSGLPHIVTRFYTVSNAKASRQSVITAVFIIGGFYLMTVVLGLGASLLVGPDQLLSAGDNGNLAAPLLALALGGNFWMAFMSAVAFATILAVVTGLVLSGSSAFAHDIYTVMLRKGIATEKQQMYAAKISAIAVGVISTLLAVSSKQLNAAFVVSFAFTVAASSLLPIILLSFYWSRYTEKGAIVGSMSGLISSLLLAVISPTFMNPIDGIIRAEPLFPLQYPGIISIPIGFIVSLLVSLWSQKSSNHGDFAYMQVKAHLGSSENDLVLPQNSSRTETGTYSEIETESEIGSASQQAN